MNEGDAVAESTEKAQPASQFIKLLGTLTGHAEPRVWHLAWDPRGDLLATCGEDRTIRLWALFAEALPAPTAAAMAAAWHCVAVLEDAHQRTIRWCEWSPNARYLATCSFDGMASVWEYNDGDFDCVASLEGHENEVKAVSWAASGTMLATCGRDKSVFIWEAEEEEYEVAAVLHSHAADVKAVAWHPQQEVLASASYDDTLKLYAPNDDDWRCFATLSAHQSTVWCLAFSPDGRGLVSCSDDRSVSLWRDLTGECGYVLAATAADVHERAVYAVSWAPEASGLGYIATASGDNAIGLLRAHFGSGTEGGNGGESQLELIGIQSDAHAGDVNSVSWRPTRPQAASTERAGWLASCGDDGAVKLWQAGS